MDELCETTVRALRAEYFADPSRGTFMLIDGASAGGLVDRLHDDGPAFDCLLSGALPPDLQEVAPYLVALVDGEPFTEWVLGAAHGQHWGVVLRAPTGLAQLVRGFRKRVRVRGPEGDPMFFRFYDPRVMRSYLPSCQDAELGVWFDAVDCYWAEAEQPQMLLRFSHHGGRLRTDTVAVG